MPNGTFSWLAFVLVFALCAEAPVKDLQRQLGTCPRNVRASLPTMPFAHMACSFYGRGCSLEYETWLINAASQCSNGASPEPISQASRDTEPVCEASGTDQVAERHLQLLQERVQELHKEHQSLQRERLLAEKALSGALESQPAFLLRLENAGVKSRVLDLLLAAEVACNSLAEFISQLLSVLVCAVVVRVLIWALLDRGIDAKHLAFVHSNELSPLARLELIRAFVHRWPVASVARLRVLLAAMYLAALAMHVKSAVAAVSEPHSWFSRVVSFVVPTQLIDGAVLLVTTASLFAVASVSLRAMRDALRDSDFVDNREAHAVERALHRLHAD